MTTQPEAVGVETLAAIAMPTIDLENATWDEIGQFWSDFGSWLLKQPTLEPSL